MTKWNRLLEILDQLLGFENKKTSTVRKVSQKFDEQKGEHVYLLEYRIRSKGVGGQKKPPEKKPLGGKKGLIRQINNLANRLK